MEVKRKWEMASQSMRNRLALSCCVKAVEVAKAQVTIKGKREEEEEEKQNKIGRG